MQHSRLLGQDWDVGRVQREVNLDMAAHRQQPDRPDLDRGRPLLSNSPIVGYLEVIRAAIARLSSQLVKIAITAD
jgi:hypothetical protein